MIEKKDLLQAIAECQGIRNPNANTCLKLASYYIILDHIEERQKEMTVIPNYSYASAPRYSSETEFGKMIEEMDEYEVMKIIDELMSALQVVNPRLYMSVIRKLEGSS